MHSRGGVTEEKGRNQPHGQSNGKVLKDQKAQAARVARRLAQSTLRRKKPVSIPPLALWVLQRGVSPGEKWQSRYMSILPNGVVTLSENENVEGTQFTVKGAHLHVYAHRKVFPHPHCFSIAPAATSASGTGIRARMAAFSHHEPKIVSCTEASMRVSVLKQLLAVGAHGDESVPEGLLSDGMEQSHPRHSEVPNSSVKIHVDGSDPKRAQHIDTTPQTSSSGQHTQPSNVSQLTLPVATLFDVSSLVLESVADAERERRLWLEATGWERDHQELKRRRLGKGQANEAPLDHFVRTRMSAMKCDWNAQYQSNIDLLFRTTTTVKEQKAILQQLIALKEDFVSKTRDVAAVLVEQLYVDHQTLESAASGGIAGGKKYVQGGVFYKCPAAYAEGKGRIYENTEAAQKASAQELRSLNALLESGRVTGEDVKLYTSLTCLHYIRGHCVMAQAQIPGVGSHSLVYGSDNAGEADRRILTGVGSSNPEDISMRRVLRSVAWHMRLKPHLVEDGQRKRHSVFFGVDCEVHRLMDETKRDQTRHYVLDLARFLPCVPPNRVIYNAYLFEMFRPEFLRSQHRALSSDACSPFGVLGQEQHDAEVAQAFKELLSALPLLASELDAIPKELLGASGGVRLSDMMHQYGINLRYLGWLFYHVQSVAAAKFIAEEMLIRCIKSLVRRWWRYACPTNDRAMRLVKYVLWWMFPSNENCVSDTVGFWQAVERVWRAKFGIRCTLPAQRRRFSVIVQQLAGMCTRHTLVSSLSGTRGRSSDADNTLQGQKWRLERFLKRLFGALSVESRRKSTLKDGHYCSLAAATLEELERDMQEEMPTTDAVAFPHSPKATGSRSASPVEELPSAAQRRPSVLARYVQKRQEAEAEAHEQRSRSRSPTPSPRSSKDRKAASSLLVFVPHVKASVMPVLPSEAVHHAMRLLREQHVHERIQTNNVARWEERVVLSQPHEQEITMHMVDRCIELPANVLLLAVKANNTRAVDWILAHPEVTAHTHRFTRFMDESGAIALHHCSSRQVLERLLSADALAMHVADFQGRLFLHCLLERKEEANPHCDEKDDVDVLAAFAISELLELAEAHVELAPLSSGEQSVTSDGVRAPEQTPTQSAASVTSLEQEQKQTDAENQLAAAGYGTYASAGQANGYGSYVSSTTAQSTEPHDSKESVQSLEDQLHADDWHTAQNANAAYTSGSDESDDDGDDDGPRAQLPWRRVSALTRFVYDDSNHQRLRKLLVNSHTSDRHLHKTVSAARIDHEAELQGHMQRMSDTSHVAQQETALVPSASAVYPESATTDVTHFVFDFIAKDDRGLTVVHLAVIHKRERALRLLLDRTVLPSSRSEATCKSGFSPLHYMLAEPFGDAPNLLEALIEAKADVNMHTSNQESEAPLHMAVRLAQSGGVKMEALSQCADVLRRHGAVMDPVVVRENDQSSSAKTHKENQSAGCCSVM